MFIAGAQQVEVKSEDELLEVIQVAIITYTKRSKNHTYSGAEAK